MDRDLSTMDSESIANFCAITDSSDTTAEYFLSAAGGDLDMAISLFYESNATENQSRNIHEISASMEARNSETGGGRVEPIPVSDSSDGEGVIAEPSRITLIPSESEGDDDVVFNASNSSSNTSAPVSRRLADIFRPPHGIMYTGSFEMARRHARDLNRWLLVTIHAPTDFASQAMNRDIWNSPQVQSFVKENFVFVQMIIGGSDASRYASFYPYDGLYPHVALIDPRTGERVETLLVASIAVPGFKLLSRDLDMLEILGEFIANHSLEDEKANEDGDDLSSKKRRSPSPEHGNELKKQQVQQEEQVTCPSQLEIPEIVPEYTESDAIVVQFRLPSGQKRRYCFDPQGGLAPIFQTAAALASFPSGSFKLRTAEGELNLSSNNTSNNDNNNDNISNLHNNTITIIK